jgi:hypothetical protein
MGRIYFETFMIPTMLIIKVSIWDAINLGCRGVGVELKGSQFGCKDFGYTFEF